MNPRIKVLVATIKFAGGGAERVIGTFLQHLDRSRFEPGLVIFRDERTYDIPADVPVWVIPKTRAWHIPAAAMGLAKLIRAWRPDVIYSHLALANLIVGAARLLGPGRPAWAAAQHLNPANDVPGWWRPVYSLLLRSSDAMVAVSKGVASALARTFHLPRSRIVAVYNPIDFSAIDRSLDQASPRGARTVVTAGRLVAEKDHATLLRAFARIRRSVDADLLILGEGGLRGDLERQAAKLGLREHVSMPGWANDPFSRMRACDVFVLSSKTEALPTALIEAMACGLPCVSTRCRYGPDEIIEDSRSGLLVPVGDDEAMAAAVLRLLGDRAEAARIAEEGSRRVRSLFRVEDRIAQPGPARALDPERRPEPHRHGVASSFRIVGA